MSEVGWDDVRELALALPDTDETTSWGHAFWRVHGKGFVWERPLRKPDLQALGITEQPGPVLGAKVDDEATKLALVEVDPTLFFTTPHFDGYPSVLVWLDRVPARRLEEIVTDAWLATAPMRLRREWLDAHAE
ncbi:MmcQ/YjbR family DNA-binding protein [Humibacter ginsenosidimutans]|uniref:MmcQ/YjbR family DNA-binding protein n=1 Tax=Humibacter ginsenosidimutans TaxID=2599293 RepID=A0A5B8M7A4_9MICO|nr:MmcQ/YjbR family DNA-binding protein [Humibacter ginsenosidimutans]QDZ16069.1 MmcQ/YjbR family DNA-binding protein [Humibacter ginsenosidimutans]